MSKSNSNTPRYREVPLGKMRVIDIAQRELKPARVDYLYRNFDLDRIGVPDVSEREGWFFIIDGQHRIEATKLWLGVGWEEQKIRCRVWSGLTEVDEADLFLALNDVLSVTAFDKFRIAVNAGRLEECDIDRQVRLEGLSVSREKVPGAIACVGTLKRVYRRSDAATLGRALRIIRDAYGDAGLEAPVIDGMGHLCQRYNGQVDDGHVVKRLGATHGGVGGLMGLAQTLREKTRQPLAHCVAAAAVEILNRGKGGKKLPSWWKS